MNEVISLLPAESRNANATGDAVDIRDLEGFADLLLDSTETRFNLELKTITVTNGGSSYSSAPTVNFTGGGGTGAAATATVSGNAVTGITITNKGSGYTSAPTISFSGGGGSGAAATATVTDPATKTAEYSLEHSDAEGSGFTTVTEADFTTVGHSDALFQKLTIQTDKLKRYIRAKMTLASADSGNPISTVASMLLIGKKKYE
ncbi:hypothetical protein EBR96_10955 [bacterium]|nr:hypothetical protein [bacterium]